MVILYTFTISTTSHSRNVHRLRNPILGTPAGVTPYRHRPKVPKH